MFTFFLKRNPRYKIFTLFPLELSLVHLKSSNSNVKGPKFQGGWDLRWLFREKFWISGTPEDSYPSFRKNTKSRFLNSAHRLILPMIRFWMFDWLPIQVVFSITTTDLLPMFCSPPQAERKRRPRFPLEALLFSSSPQEIYSGEPYQWVPERPMFENF